MSGIEVAGFVLSAFPVAIQLARIGVRAANGVRDLSGKSYRDGLNSVARDLMIQNSLFLGGYEKLRMIEPKFPSLENVEAAQVEPGSTVWMRDFLSADAQWPSPGNNLDLFLELIRQICSELQELVQAMRQFSTENSMERMWSKINFVLSREKRDARLVNLRRLIAQFRELVKDRKAQLRSAKDDELFRPFTGPILPLKRSKDDIRSLCQTIRSSWGCQCQRHSLSIQLTQAGVDSESVRGFYVLCTNRPQAPRVLSKTQCSPYTSSSNEIQDLRTAIRHIDLTMSSARPSPLQVRLRHKHGTVRKISEIQSTPSVSWHGHCLCVRVYGQNAASSARVNVVPSSVEDIPLCDTFQKWSSVEYNHNKTIDLKGEERHFRLSAAATISRHLAPISLLDALRRPDEEGRILSYERSKLKVALQIASSSFWLMANPSTFSTPVNIASIFFYPDINNGLFNWESLRQSYAEVSPHHSTSQPLLSTRQALLSLGVTLYQLLENRPLDVEPDILRLIACMQLDRHLPVWRSVLDHCFSPERYNISNSTLDKQNIDGDSFLNYIYPNIIFPLAKAVIVAESAPWL